MQADNQIQTLPIVTDHDGIVTLKEIFDFRKTVVPEKKPEPKPEPIKEEKKSEPVKKKEKEPKNEMDSEMQAAMKANHLFGRIAQDFSSDEDVDDDDYGAELRQA